jgi:hypothetical protein
MQTEVAVQPGLSLERCIQVFDGALTPEFCVQIVQSFNRMKQFHVPNGRGQKRGFDASAWTELNISPLADTGMKGFSSSRSTITWHCTTSGSN